MTNESMGQPLAALPVDNLLEKIAGDRPILPAGGSAVALAGATAAAMGGFVSRIARRHAETDAAVSAIDPIVCGFDRLRRRLADLMTEDVRAYSGAMAARRDGRSDPEAVRLKMTGPPEAMANDGLELFDLLSRLLSHVYEPTRADAAVAVELARSCIDGAIRIWQASAGKADDAAGSNPMADRIETLRRIRDERYEALCRHL